MKLYDRQPIEGTSPVVYIGHRAYRAGDGTERMSVKWYAEFTRQRQRHYEALGTNNKQAAIRKVFQILERLDRGESKPVQRQTTWEELHELYMEYQTNHNRSPRTLGKYEHDLKTLVEFAKEQKIPLPVHFRREHFWRFNKQLLDQGLSPKTVYVRMILVKQVFKWGAKNKLLAEYVLANESMEEPPSPEQPCFTAAQVEAILKNAYSVDRPIFALMAYSGMRFGEVRDLRWSDLHLDRGQHGQIYVKRGGSNGTTKGKAHRIVPINGQLRPIIDALPRLGDLVFYEPAPAAKPDAVPAPLVERTLLMRLKSTCRLCKFDNPRQYKLHTFRHAFASMCARTSTSNAYALRWMGHKSSEILDLYTKMYDDVADDAMSRLNYTTPPAPKPDGPKK